MTIMKIKGLLLAILLACILTGCQLAREDNSKSRDRLVGVFITQEYLDLFDFEGYLNDNLNNLSGGEIKGDQSQYEGRLYASFEGDDKENVEFGDVWGIPLFIAELVGDDGSPRTTTYNGDGVVDSKFGTYYGDDEDKITLDGTVYIEPGVAGLTHYFNKVYQSADGQIYATSGQGMSVHGVQSQGEVMSTKLEDTLTITENGKTKKKTSIINIAIETKLTPYKINVIMLDTDNNVVSDTEYAPSKLPEKINIDKKANYIIVESHVKDFDGTQLIERQLYDKNATSISTFYESENNLLAQQYTELAW